MMVIKTGMVSKESRWMLQVKSVAIVKANLGILKCGGGLNMWIWLCAERKSYLGFRNRVRMRKIGRNIMWQKDAYGSESSKGSSVRYLESGVVKVSVDDWKKIWKEHMEKLINVENEWSNIIDDSKLEGAMRRIETEDVLCAMHDMKILKAESKWDLWGCYRIVWGWWGYMFEIFDKNIEWYLVQRLVTRGMDVTFVSTNF